MKKTIDVLTADFGKIPNTKEQETAFPKVESNNIEAIDKWLDVLSYHKNEFEKIDGEYKLQVANIEKARTKAKEFLNKKIKEATTTLEQFYNNPIKVERKIGEQVVEVLELPTQLKFNRVMLRQSTSIEYDQKALLENEKYIRIKKEINKLKIRSEMKKQPDLKIDGVVVKKTIKVSIRTKDKQQKKIGEQ